MSAEVSLVSTSKLYSIIIYKIIQHEKISTKTTTSMLNGTKDDDMKLWMTVLHATSNLAPINYSSQMEKREKVRKNLLKMISDDFLIGQT